MNTPDAALTIGAVACAAEVGVETVRFYQRKGLLAQPPRPAGGIRRYGEEDVARIAFIKAAQRLGFSLEEVASLLKLEDGTHCRQARGLAQEKLAEVRARLADLKRMEGALSALVRQCDSARGKVCCPLISALQRQPARQRRMAGGSSAGAPDL